MANPIGQEKYPFHPSTFPPLQRSIYLRPMVDVALIELEGVVFDTVHRTRLDNWYACPTWHQAQSVHESEDRELVSKEAADGDAGDPDEGPADR